MLELLKKPINFKIFNLPVWAIVASALAAILIIATVITIVEVVKLKSTKKSYTTKFTKVDQILSDFENKNDVSQSRANFQMPTVSAISEFPNPEYLQSSLAENENIKLDKKTKLSKAEKAVKAEKSVKAEKAEKIKPSKRNKISDEEEQPSTLSKSRIEELQNQVDNEDDVVNNKIDYFKNGQSMRTKVSPVVDETEKIDDQVPVAEVAVAKRNNVNGFDDFSFDDFDVVDHSQKAVETAPVEENATVEENALVAETVLVEEDQQIVAENAPVEENATVEENALVAETVLVEEDQQIVAENAPVEENATVEEYAIANDFTVQTNEFYAKAESETIEDIQIDNLSQATTQLSDTEENLMSTLFSDDEADKEEILQALSEVAEVAIISETIKVAEDAAVANANTASVVAETDITEEVAEVNLAEQAIAESASAEQELADMKAREQELAETKAREQELAETTAREQELAETKAREQELAETKAREQELAETKAREQELADIKAHEQELADIKAHEQELAETKAREQELEETKAHEQELADMKAREQEKAAAEKLVELKAEEEKLAERKSIELKNKEQIQKAAEIAALSAINVSAANSAAIEYDDSNPLEDEDFDEFNFDNDQEQAQQYNAPYSGAYAQQANYNQSYYADNYEKNNGYSSQSPQYMSGFEQGAPYNNTQSQAYPYSAPQQKPQFAYPQAPNYASRNNAPSDFYPNYYNQNQPVHNGDYTEMPTLRNSDEQYSPNNFNAYPQGYSDPREQNDYMNSQYANSYYGAQSPNANAQNNQYGNPTYPQQSQAYYPNGYTNNGYSPNAEYDMQARQKQPPFNASTQQPYGQNAQMQPGGKFNQQPPTNGTQSRNTVPNQAKETPNRQMNSAPVQPIKAVQMTQPKATSQVPTAPTQAIKVSRSSTPNYQVKRATIKNPAFVEIISLTDNAIDENRGRFTIFKDLTDPTHPYKFQLITKNNQVLFESQGFKVKPRVQQIDAFRKVITTGSFEYNKEPNGAFRFNLLTASNRLCGVGDMYKNLQSAEKAALATKKYGLAANYIQDISSAQ